MPVLGFASWQPGWQRNQQTTHLRLEEGKYCKMDEMDGHSIMTPIHFTVKNNLKISDIMGFLFVENVLKCCYKRITMTMVITCFQQMPKQEF